MMGNPVRILRVVGRMDRGGLETIIMNAYRIVDRDKVQFDFIMHTDDECAYNDEILSLGGRIFSVPKYNGKNHLQYTNAWKNFFEEHDEYKVIHGHVRSTAAIYLKIAKKYGLTTIAHSHNTSSGKGLSALTKDLLQLPVRYIGDYLFACSTPAGKWLFGNDVINKTNFKVIPNGIDVERYSFDPNIRDEVKKEFGIMDKIVIGNVGRFHPQKNHKFLISVFKKINDINPNTVLMLVGDGQLREEIVKQIDDNDLTNNVILTGSRKDVPRLLQSMDVFVFPSLFEGFGNVVIEAQSSGLPCVVSKNIPSEVRLTDLVDFVNTEKGIEYWAEKILEKAITHQRKNTKNEIIKAGYDITPIAKWYEDFYLKISNGANTKFS